MTLRLTPDMLAAGYDFLRMTEPFKGWKLPDSDDIGFQVGRDSKAYADFGIVDGVPTIRVSEATVGHTATLIAIIAHEAIHLHQHLRKLAKGGEHNADFKRRAARVCKIHGFDIKAF